MSSLGEELRRLFPDGTDPDGGGNDPRDLTLPPYMPTDLFAAAAHLLERSGAYQFIVAPFAPGGAAGNPYDYSAPTFCPAKADLRRWADVGRRWMDDPGVRGEIQPFWDVLLACSGDKLVLTLGGGAPVPRWWSACHAMLVIADEASSDFGYDFGPSTAAARWANRLAGLTLEKLTERRPIPCPGDPADDGHLSRHVALDSLGSAIERHVARVFPKGRTTETGCTLRTFSHNLTLLPPHGGANAYWHRHAGTARVADPDRLNVLLVPFPYVIPQASFHGAMGAHTPPEVPWGRFRVDQRWLRPDGSGVAGHGADWSTPDSRKAFADFLDALVAAAEAAGAGPIQGVVLPELSLDWDTYDAVVRRLCRDRPDVEFIVAGVSKDCNGREGNQVTTSILRDAPSGGRRIAETHSRRKHHRWQVDGGQVRDYGLEADLDPGVTWWEHHSVEERVLHIDVLREGSTMTAVICEDLARVDPGLALLRSLGPNLVFALLMDGPQLKSRWPGTYATALADDPGSSVLSLTCAGMVKRSNATFVARDPGATVATTIALWKNRPGPGSSTPPNDFAQIDLSSGSHGVVLRLAGTRAHETTLDGRPNTDTTAWYLRDHKPVGVGPAVLDALDLRWITDPA